MVAITKHFEPSIEEAKNWGRERVTSRIQIQASPTSEFFPLLPLCSGRKASAESSEGKKSGSKSPCVEAQRGMEGNQRTRWKWRKMSVSGYMPWSLHRVQDLGGKEKNSGLRGCVINPLSRGWAKEEGVGSKRLNSSKSTSLGNGAPLGKLSKESFLKCMVFYFLRYGPWTWPRRR